MGLLDVFTGAPAKEAAEKNRLLLQQNQATGTGTLQGNLASGTGILQNNQTAGAGTLQNNQTAGTTALQGGQTSAIGALDQAAGAYQPLSALAAKYGGGTGLYMDSLGVNGPQGNTRATDAFRAGPGYDYRVSQALDGVNRAASVNGGVAGGNTLAALSDRAGNMASQEYGGWQDRLAGLVNPELQATSGAAGGTAAARLGQAGVYQGTAGKIADLGTNTAGALVGLGTNTANRIADLGTNTATGIVGLGTNTANGVSSQNTQEANAELQGSKNLWGLGLGAATALASGGTSLLGGGGLSSLGSMFGGTSTGATAGGYGAGGGFGSGTMGGIRYPAL